ncbi:MAG: hypothetical protein J1E61_00875 [Lachnospiraceae bacterium]|nr:hypothetical protein [Lachnospiraceae bacterium]
MEKIIVCILFCLSILASVTKVLTGFDIDEAYALAIPYRVLQGDRLFADMWEVHQTSFLLPYLFMKIFYGVVSEGTGVVLFVRIITTLIHGIVSFFVYLAVGALLRKGETGKGGTFPATLLGLGFYNFLPKWMISLDFSMQQLWFFVLYLLCLLLVLGAGKNAEKKGFRCFWGLFLAGIFLSLDVLAYPGMAVLYPVSLLLLVWGKGAGKDKGLKAAGLTAGCAASAGIFFLCIFRYMSPKDLAEAVPKVFMDGSHQYDLAVKLSLYVSQWLEVIVQAVILMAPALLLMLVLCLVWKKTVQDKSSQKEKTMDRLPAGLLFCVLFELTVSALIVLAGMFVTWGSFRLQVRYIVQFVMACFLFSLWKKEEENEKVRLCLWGLILSGTAFAGILAASNVGPSSSASYLVVGNLLFMLFTLQLAKKRGRIMQVLGTAGAVLFVVSLIMCKGFYMRNTEYVPGDITDPLQRIEEGPLAGIYVREEDYVRYTADYATIQANTTEKDQVLFMGTESLCNLYANGRPVIPTTISTPAFNEQWVEYFTLYPDKCPTIIFLAKNTVDDRDKFFAKNPFGIWIAEHYNVEYMEETSSLCMIKPREESRGE